MDRTRLLTAGASLLASTLILSGRVTAQETEQQPEPEKHVLNPLTPSGEETPQEEMIRLFHEVERSLEAIDVGLAEAGAGDAPLQNGESGIDRLLKGTSEKGRQAVDGIDRILQLAQEMSGKSGGT